jgi:D-alanyl-lipoteichoic acid acyltransferase DltB (MBOAT superfamily)
MVPSHGLMKGSLTWWFQISQFVGTALFCQKIDRTIVVVFTLYYLLPHKFRWMLLLAASYFFYMCWRPEYAVLLAFSSLVGYCAALCMEELVESQRRYKQILLALSIMANLAPLFLFKYYAFFHAVLGELLPFGLAGATADFELLLPIGISFYTFQSIGYSVDVYRGERSPEKHLGIFALYVSFFPQLVAGPIERASHMLPQFRRPHRLVYEQAVEGLRLILWGLYKKVVVADRLSLYVDAVYGNAFRHDSALSFLLATYFFAFQIYCDFSAYADIARGCGKLFGFELSPNFRLPYGAGSLAEFWRRWHISLSTWWRDYLYIPLGGNRAGVLRRGVNLVAVFLVSGLWHGAAWTFIVWGVVHGVFFIWGAWTMSWRTRWGAAIGRIIGRPLYGWVQCLVTFHLVCFGWIFFRAESLAEAVYIIDTLYVGHWLPFFIGGKGHFIYGVWGIATVLLLEGRSKGGDMGRVLTEWGSWQRWTFYLFCILSFLLIGVHDGAQFIYFQF